LHHYEPAIAHSIKAAPPPSSSTNHNLSRLFPPTHRCPAGYPIHSSPNNTHSSINRNIWSKRGSTNTSQAYPMEKLSPAVGLYPIFLLSER
jgi:hypothetical protein